MKEELTYIARIIINRQFPGEWEKFKNFALEILIDNYEDIIEDDWSRDEAIEFFKQSVFEAGRDIHEGLWGTDKMGEPYFMFDYNYDYAAI